VRQPQSKPNCQMMVTTGISISGKMSTGNDHVRGLLGEGDGGGAPDADSTGNQDNLSAHSTILCWAAGNPPQETPMSDLFGFVVRILTSPVRYLGGQGAARWVAASPGSARDRGAKA
jgi:hypothetical protein